MKRGIAVLLSLSVLAAAAYFGASKWAIRHETLTLFDTSRENRPVAVRRDKEVQVNVGMLTLPVAILVKNTEYSFLANVFAARGYLVLSIQDDLATDPPMVTRVGELYVGRLPQIERDIANIRFAVEEIKKIQSNADFDHLTMVGHSMGADVSLYFAKMYPDKIRKVVTLRQSARAFHDGRQVQNPVVPVFKPDPGVIPDDAVCQKAGITVVRTDFQHNDMRDTGPEEARLSIQSRLGEFLDNDSSSSIDTREPATSRAENIAARE
jgi:pimeloyl-ACP methyl ester carboxylesterase